MGQDIHDFDYRNATPESLGAFLLPRMHELDEYDKTYVANNLEMAGRVAALVEMRDFLGFDTTGHLTRMLEWGLSRSTNTDGLLRLDGEERPLISQVPYLLKSGADPSQIQDLDGILARLPHDREEIRRLLEKERPHVSLDLLKGTLGADVADNAQVQTLRESSGQDWKRDPSGNVYLHVPDVETMSEVSGILSRMGIVRSYGWPGVVQENKTTIVIPAGVLEDMTERDIRNVGQAVGLQLGTEGHTLGAAPSVSPPARSRRLSP